jgi:hypothetical protein
LQTYSLLDCDWHSTKKVWAKLIIQYLVISIWKRMHLGFASRHSFSYTMTRYWKTYTYTTLCFTVFLLTFELFRQGRYFIRYDFLIETSWLKPILNLRLVGYRLMKKTFIVQNSIFVTQTNGHKLSAIFWIRLWICWYIKQVLSFFQHIFVRLQVIDII